MNRIKEFGSKVNPSKRDRLLVSIDRLTLAYYRESVYSTEIKIWHKINQLYDRLETMR